jgi:hypothetical protein
MRASRRIPADWHRGLGEGLRFLAGGGGRATDGGRLAAFAAARGLDFGYWVHVFLEIEPGAESQHEVQWCFPLASAASRPRRLLEGEALARRFASFYPHAIDALGEPFVGFLQSADGKRTIRDLAARAGGGDALCAHLTDLATALAQIGLVAFEAASSPSEAS